MEARPIKEILGLDFVGRLFFLKPKQNILCNEAMLCYVNYFYGDQNEIIFLKPKQNII